MTTWFVDEAVENLCTDPLVTGELDLDFIHGVLVAVRNKLNIAVDIVDPYEEWELDEGQQDRNFVPEAMFADVDRAIAMLEEAR